MTTNSPTIPAFPDARTPSDQAIDAAPGRQSPSRPSTWTIARRRQFMQDVEWFGFTMIAADASGLGRQAVSAILEAGEWAMAQGYEPLQGWRAAAAFTRTHAQARARWAQARLAHLNEGKTGRAGRVAAVTWQLERAMPGDFGEQPPTNEGAMALVLALRGAGEVFAMAVREGTQTRAKVGQLVVDAEGWVLPEGA